MNASRRHLLIALLLPLLAMRAVLPAGFMPVADDGGLRVVMCSAGLALPAGDGADHGTDGMPAGAENCLFALSVFHAPPPVLPVHTLSSITIAEAAPGAYHSATTATIHRAQSPRAPPALCA